MQRITSLFLVSLGVTAGCGIDIEELVTIEQGIYGEYTHYQNTGDSLSQVASQNAIVSIFSPEDGVTIDTYNSEYVETGTALPEALVTTTTDDNGFFEFDLDSGDYLLCVGNRPLIENPSEEAGDIDSDQAPVWIAAQDIYYEVQPLCTNVTVSEDVAQRHDMISDGWSVTWL